MGGNPFDSLRAFMVCTLFETHLFSFLVNLYFINSETLHNFPFFFFFPFYLTYTYYIPIVSALGYLD